MPGQLQAFQEACPPYPPNLWTLPTAGPSPVMVTAQRLPRAAETDSVRSVDSYGAFKLS